MEALIENAKARAQASWSELRRIEKLENIDPLAVRSYKAVFWVRWQTLRELQKIQRRLIVKEVSNA
jgi:hypothetical protein